MARMKPCDPIDTIPGDLHDLDRQLRRQRALAGRLWRNYRATDQEANTLTSIAAHRAWSDAVRDAIT
jgi:hypothetical protein